MNVFLAREMWVGTDKQRYIQMTWMCSDFAGYIGLAWRRVELIEFLVSSNTDIDFVDVDFFDYEYDYYGFLRNLV